MFMVQRSDIRARDIACPDISKLRFYELLENAIVFRRRARFSFCFCVFIDEELSQFFDGWVFFDRVTFGGRIGAVFTPAEESECFTACLLWRPWCTVLTDRHP